MQESFLHYIWQHQYFNKQDLQTVTGEKVNIFYPGIKNTDGGPDFHQSRLMIDEVEWHGSTEIHIKATDWNNHAHQLDAAYNNVVLHVVWEYDKPVYNAKGAALPTLVLKNRVKPELLVKFENLISYPSDIPCSPVIKTVPEIIILNMLDKVLPERMHRKTIALKALLDNNGQDWEETTYQTIASNFGFKINSEAFLQLSQAVPFKLIQKHADNLLQTEAMLFGTAGFLNAPKIDDYHGLLKREYSLLSHKYELHKVQMEEHQWKFLRLRPANFPTIRIAQLAALFYKREKLFSFIREAETAEIILKFFTVSQSIYWKSHYHFGNESNTSIPGMGKSSAENLIINSVAPLLSLYATQKDEQEFIDRSILLLQQTRAESNRITNRWKELDQQIKNAFDSQAYIELYNNYCLLRQCSYCKVGFTILKK